RLDYRVFRQYRYFFYIVMVAALVAVQFFGTTALGAQRWITIGFFQFQPTEFAKLLLIITLARFFADNYEHSHELSFLIISFVFITPPVFLVLIQPDLGSAMVFIAIWLVMILASRVKKSNMLALGLIVAI